MFCECGLPRMVLQREACIGDSNQSRETKKALTNKVASHGSASLKTDSTSPRARSKQVSQPYICSAEN